MGKAIFTAEERCLLKHRMQPVGILGETTRSPLVRNVKGIEHSARDVASRVPAAVSGYGLRSTLRGVHRESTVVLRAVDSDLLPAQNATGSEVRDSENLVWGEDFEERFSLGEVIGHGQQGLVRKVVRRETGDVYAAKVLSREASVGLMRDTDEKKMRSEAIFLHKLQGCPVVARMEGAYFDDQHVYIVMERLDGGNIADNLDQGGCFAEKESAELMREVLGFLAHSHELGIFYGDVKPENFMLGMLCQGCPHPCRLGRLQGLTLKAIDFGCCQQVIPGVHFRKRAGSPLYMAPEVYLGRYGKEADLWSAGVMLFQLLSGKMPFAEYDDNGEIVDAGFDLGYSFDSEPWKTVSPKAKDLIAQLLVRIPQKRLSAKQALNHTWFAETQDSMDDGSAGLEASSIVAAPEDLPVTQSVSL